MTLSAISGVVTMSSKPDIEHAVESQRRTLKFSERVERQNSAYASESRSPHTCSDDHWTGRPSRTRGDIECVKLLPRGLASNSGGHRVDGVARSVDYRSADYSDIA